MDVQREDGRSTRVPMKVIRAADRQQVTTLGMPTPVAGLALTDPLQPEARHRGMVCVTHQPTGTLVALMDDPESAGQFVLAVADVDWTAPTSADLARANPGLPTRVRELCERLRRGHSGRHIAEDSR